MYLTEAERRSALEEAHRFGVDGDPEGIVKQALQAICTGEAEDAAYSVARAAGIQFIGQHIWVKETPEMNAEKARAILAEAKRNGSYEAPIPEDDSKAISEARDLVEMAQGAWDQYVRGPEVEAILRLANEDFGGSSDPTPTPAPAAAPATPEEAAPAPAAEFQPEPAPEPPSEEDLSQVEPWQGYDKDKVGEVIAGINAASKEYSEEDLHSLLANVWAYESAHKSRKTILDHLEDVAKRLQNGDPLPDDPPGTNQPRADVEAPAAPQPEPEAPAPAAEHQQEQPAADPAAREELEDEITGKMLKAYRAGREDIAKMTDGELRLMLANPDGEVYGAPEWIAERQKSSLPLPNEIQARLDAEREAAEKAAAEAAAKKAEAATKEKPAQTVDTSTRDTSTGDDDSDYQSLIAHVEEELKQERLHIPSKPAEEAPELPWEWTKMTDRELQNYYGYFSNLAYYKAYLLERDERMVAHCRQAADELHSQLLVAADKYDDHGKQKTMTLLEAEIESDENVKLWRRRQRKHEARAANNRRERDSMGKLIEQLSRLESMRDQEWRRSGSGTANR